jgi:arabinoxylan arabinofuranohydrolase
MMNSVWAALALVAVMSVASPSGAGEAKGVAPGSNPIIRDKFTADPAPLVVGDRLFLYTGHDEAQRDEMFNMREWLVYSTTDMKTWTAYPPIMKATDFKWAKKDAWASQAIEKNGKFYFYAAVEHDSSTPARPSAWRSRTARPVPSSTRADRP